MNGLVIDPKIVEISRLAEAEHLAVFGVLNPTNRNSLSQKTKSLVLLGPHEPGFWAHVSNAREFLDDQPDAIDRWSLRVIDELANAVGGSAVFPFGGPPYAPFIDWALKSGRTWTSPVTLLVHDVAGLFVSFRGAIALPYEIQPQTRPVSPCASCAATPCKTACPVGALTQGGYDVAACRSYLNTEAGQDCMDNGCAVRRVCPISQSYGRLPAQSAYHMKVFHR